MMNYIGYTFKASPKEPVVEILIAQLGSIGFESFVENEDGVTAYIQEKDWKAEILNDIQILNSDEFEITYKEEVIAQTNWNSEWEKNFHQIEVDGLVSIRAPFHENPIPKNNGIKYDIVIEPKMSFGTGHHETTHMMVQQLLAMDLKDKKVLDMGCGTGILAIFAEMKGANPIDAIDIDTWCYENSLENVERNNCSNISVFEGNASVLINKKYDVIIANINRNILLNDMKLYMESLNEEGVILFSGFYQEDIPIIDAEASKYNVTLEKTIERNNWVSLKYKK
ncbi:50S ribosomal protein L11 methyltransferase [Lutibacter sp.]